jgi:hypothetical protein
MLSSDCHGAGIGIGKRYNADWVVCIHTMFVTSRQVARLVTVGGFDE